MENTAEKPNLISLKLLIDKEKNKVVLAEAGSDFVEVLSSLLTLPMGTIVRLMEKHQKPQSSIVGCFHNLYKGVSDMDVGYFQNGACKNLLLYPRSVYEFESHRRKLKLNVDDTEATKFFLCPNFISDQCCKVYSNLSTTRCSTCRSLMTREVQVKEVQADEDFLSDRTSFIITNDLKVALNSAGHLLNVLNDLGYDGFQKLQEQLVDFGFEEAVNLLGCLSTSEAPLTDAFLKKDCMTWKSIMSKPLVQESAVARDPDKLLTLKVYVRKTDHKILFAECREDFLDFLFTFLAIPLEFAWELSIDTANKGCIGNLCRSLKEMSFEHHGKSQVHRYKLPYYYNIRSQLLDVDVEEVPEYELLDNFLYHIFGKLSKKIPQNKLSQDHRILKVVHVDSIVKASSGSACKGFLKGHSSFIVLDSLFVVPVKTCSTISLLRELKIKFSEIEEQVISIGKFEAISLLRASLISTTALNNGLSNFLSKLKPTKATPSTSKIKTENNL